MPQRQQQQRPPPRAPRACAAERAGVELGGVVIVEASSGHLLFHRALQPHFGQTLFAWTSAMHQRL